MQMRRAIRDLATTTATTTTTTTRNDPTNDFQGRSSVVS